MALDPSIIFMGKTPDFQKSLGESIDFGQGLRKLVVGRKIGQMNQLATPEEKQAFIQKNNLFGRELFQTLKDQEVAATQAEMAKQKHEVDIYSARMQGDERKSNAYKNTTQGQGYELDNAGKVGSAVQKAIGFGATTGNKQAIIDGLNLGKSTGEITPEAYQTAITALGNLNSIDDIKKFGLAMLDPKYSLTTADNVLDNKTLVDNNIRSTSVQKYGIDKTAETADENRAVEEKKLAFQKQQAYFEKNKPVGFGVDVNGRKYAILPNGNSVYIKDENGNYVIEQVKSGNGGGLTEQQSKDALFGARMQESHKILTDLEGEGVSKTWVSRLPMIGDRYSQVMPSVLGGANSKQQQYAQAQRDFINAVLRKESGAVIADSEFENAQKQYFPQIGDSDEVIAQKAKNRELAMKMIVNGSGVQGKTLINGATNSQGQLQPGQVPSAGAGGSALSFYK